MADLNDLNINDNGFLSLPSGTTAQRPNSAINGDMRFNTSTGLVEVYMGNRWAVSGGMIDFDFNQRNTEESFGVGNSQYYRSNYEVSVTTTRSDDIILLQGRMNWSFSDNDDEIGFGWGYNTDGSNNYSILKFDNVTGNDNGSGRYGTVTGSHNDDQNSQFGDQIGVMDVVFTPGSANTWYFVPACLGSNNTGSTLKINRYASDSSGPSTWDNLGSSTVVAMVFAGGLTQY